MASKEDYVPQLLAVGEATRFRMLIAAMRGLYPASFQSENGLQSKNVQRHIRILVDAQMLRKVPDVPYARDAFYLLKREGLTEVAVLLQKLSSQTAYNRLSSIDPRGFILFEAIETYTRFDML